jgi:hypothetical protein
MLGRLERLQQAAGGAAWPGGLAFHQDAFAPLASMLLTLHSAAGLLALRPAPPNQAPAGSPAAGDRPAAGGALDGQLAASPAAGGQVAAGGAVDEQSAASPAAGDQPAAEGGFLGSQASAEGIRRCVRGFLALPLQPLLGNMLAQVPPSFLCGMCVACMGAMTHAAASMVV